jgi:CubicO group peptidase (beta-lactamase class C family)
MKSIFKFILYSIGLLTLVILLGCKQKEKELSLKDKITLAVESRRIPPINNQKIIFSSPHWIEERGSQTSEILRHVENYLPTISIEKGSSEVTDLPVNLSSSLGKEILTSTYFKKETSLDQLCEQKNLDGVIVLHKGHIIYEKYPDMDSSDKHIYFSISKSFVGTVIAKLADNEKLNEQDSIGKYLVEFRNKPLGKVSINDLLRMASAINCRELVEDRVSFTNPEHCFYKYLQYSGVYPEPENGFDQSLMEFLANAGIYETAGKTYDYTSTNTVILSTLAERVSGKPYHELVSEFIWSKIGAENDARITLSNTGIAGSSGFMMSRLRDLARYGFAFTDDAPTKIASDRYLKLLREGDKDLFFTDKPFAAIFEGLEPVFQSYHWDVVFEDGDFAKFGLAGQGLYISPEKRLIVAFFSSNKNETHDNYGLYYLVRSLALLDQFRIKKS